MPLNLLYFTVLSLIINTWNSIFINFLKKKEYCLVFFRKLQLKFKTKDKKTNKFISAEKKIAVRKFDRKKTPRDRWLAFGASFQLIARETPKNNCWCLMLGLALFFGENWNFRTHSHNLTPVVGQFLLLTYELKIESCWTWSIEQMLLKLGTYTYLTNWDNGWS